MKMNNYWDMYEPDVKEYYDTPLRDFDYVEKQRLQHERNAGLTLQQIADRDRNERR
jgi:hypothetical protein